MDSVPGNTIPLDTRIKRHGNHNENDVNQVVKAGQLSMTYERGNLRHISIANHEVLRMIYPSVRAKEWLTINPVITDEEFEILPDSFMIRYNAHYKSGEIDFILKCNIEGRNDNSLNISMDGEAISSFEKNRIGFCILHPVEECAGKTCVITHSNNLTENQIFPPLVSPARPFTDIKSMNWIIDGHECKLDFYGDVFETEDQRNWTDASYKTYSTPIKIPYPVKISKGEKIIQEVELKIEGEIILKDKAEEEIEIIALAEKKVSLPMIGIGMTSRSGMMGSEEIQILNKLNFDHCRIDLHLYREWKTKADIPVKEAAELKWPIEFALFTDNNFQKQISEFLPWIKKHNLLISAIILYHKDMASTPVNIIEVVSPEIRYAFPDVKIIAGTNANFAQLNKTRPDSAFMDCISYSLQPQEHASDNLTLVENLQGQSYTIETAKNFIGGKDVWISPVNIQRRFNANSGYYEQPFEGEGCPPQVDSRMMSLFGACWTAGSLKYVTEAGVTGVTYFETVGERGIMQGNRPSRWPEYFHSAEGMLFPVWFVFRFLLQDKSCTVIKSVSTQPLKVNCLILSGNTGLKMLVVNFSSKVQKVKLKFRGHKLSLKQLNDDTYKGATSDVNWLWNTSSTTIKNDALFLKPYSIGFIEESR